jgi:transcriptional regulator with XRE-family HTH domain
VIGMSGASWPVRDFNEYVEAAMDGAGIKDREELSELSGVSPTQLSNYKSGKSQPSRKSLEKLAIPLRVPVRNLLLQAGLMSLDDFAEPPDLTIVPAQVRELLDLLADERVTEGEREFLLSHVSVVVAGVRARLNVVDESSRPVAKRPRRAREAG